MFINDNDLFIPILIPKATEPQVTGMNSSWVISGITGAALLLGAALFGPSMKTMFKSGPKKKSGGGGTKKKRK